MTFWAEPTKLVDRLHKPFRSTRVYRRGFKRALDRLRELAESEEPVARVTVAGLDRIPAFNA